MIIAHNGTCTQNCDVLADIRIAKETGYDGIEMVGEKLYRYLDQGFGIETIRKVLEGFSVVGLGYIQDIERYQPDHKKALLREAEKMCSLAQKLDCSLVQILTGPIGPGIGESVPDSYRDIMSMSWSELRKITAGNISEISEIGKQYNVGFYLEALSWAPIHSLEQMLELIDTAGCSNVGVLIDFWHCFTSGSKPDDIARLNKNIIKAVHFCDSVKGDGSSHDDRDIWTGAGCIPLKEWVDAVAATGYDGWISCELFSHKHWDMDPCEVARRLREHLEFVLL